MSAERFLFGEFEFDAATRVLTHKGRVVKLQAQPAQLLSVLLARSGRAVSREELKQAIWGDNTYVDFEKGLNFCIGQIRLALRDDASRPLYIRTLPKVGYQFIAPVEKADANADGRTSQPATRSSRMQWILLAGSCIGIVLLVMGIVAYRSRARAYNPPKLAVLRFDAETAEPGTQKLADDLTDDVVVQLTSSSAGHYRVIGNARILRTPRDQRDLGAIASALDCKYVVLGQVRSEGDKVLILAHLIRLSDLTHIGVVRIEQKVDSPMELEAKAASEVASQFAAKMADQPDKASSFPNAKH